MLNLSVVTATALLGLAGGVHCVAMCGPASVAIARTPADAAWFHLGRFLGYGVLGGLASAGAVGMAHVAGAAAWLHPIWLLSHVLLAMLGGWMLLTGRHPRWVQEGLLRAARSVLRASSGPAYAGSGVTQRVMTPAAAGAGMGQTVEVRVPVAGIGRNTSPGKAPTRSTFLIGIAWALWPCGILYSAIAIAWLTQDVLTGTVAMMAFAAGSGVQLWLGQRGLMALMRAGKESLGIRLAGALTFSFALALIVWVAMGNLPSDFCLPGS
ncbi:sulfite exporter TauE/SafE family protein [Pigmentiphaga aceris]|uniref:Sulfite exporter TauE/SafE family protein n=1 Tax=Pigmentiphaga aceris TaxID=1940612 RepID=A0A5C0AYB7_9BURK|nr:sulfite exporter TauE/SafE family protein [Pigmentiphaga aceris]QEI05377.1 sulfite exporter TauE/SafE family protein [Pigmentiphaga aceris]